MAKRSPMSAVSMLLSIITSAAVYFAQCNAQVKETLKASFTSAKTIADLIKESFKTLKVGDVNLILSAVDTSNKMFEQIEDQKRYILHYAEKIKENFYHKIQSPFPFVFLFEEQYTEMQTTISEKYHINLARLIRDLKVSEFVTNIAQKIFIIIPTDFYKTKAHIFHIIPYPIYKGNSSYLPILPHQFFAASAKTGGEFTPIHGNEQAKCKSEAFCELASPTYKAAIAPCGIANYFKQYTDMCHYL